MRDIREIFETTPAQECVLAERIHEAVKHFKNLRSSSFWNVQTFRVRDIGLFLDEQQCECLAARIGLALSIPSTAEVLPLIVDLPDDLDAAPDQMYAIAHSLDWIRKNDPNFDQQKFTEPAKIIIRKLQFVTVKRPKAEAA